MQHVDQSALLNRFLRAVVAVGLEEPVLRWSLDPQSGSRQAVDCHLNIGFSHYKIDIVARLGPAVHPEGIAATEREGNAIGLQG
jgi:hypothetical protein